MDKIGDVLGVSAEEFLQEYYRHNYITNVEGKPWIEACLSAVRVFNDSKEAEEKVRKIQNDFNNSKQLNEELVQKIIDLKERGFKLAILSNFTTELRGILKEHGIYKHFDKVFVSGEMGTQKPAPEAFAAVCKDLEILPNEMVFIDDSPKSLETSEEVGFTPLLFEGNEKLFEDLRGLGIMG